MITKKIIDLCEDILRSPRDTGLDDRVTPMNEAVQTEFNEVPSWAWIRFIPVKLHIAGLWSGAGLGYLIDKQLSTEWFFCWGIGLLMALVGSYWQVQKELIRKSFREK